MEAVKPTTRLLRGTDAVSALVDIWLDGFCSGVSTTVAEMGAPEEKADSFAQRAGGGHPQGPAHG